MTRRVDDWFKALWSMIKGTAICYLDFWQGGDKYAKMELELEKKDMIIRALRDGDLKGIESITPEIMAELLEKEGDRRIERLLQRMNK